MKRFLSIALLIAILLSCCACGKKEQQPQAAAPTETVPATTLDPASAEALYGHIDQTVPVEGVYKIWNAEGVKNMANHPDGSFEILCNIDMQGAVLRPISPFTGTINGGTAVISNFTINQSVDGYLGFVGINKGTLENLTLEQVTVISDENARFIGTLAGSNAGKLLRCKVSGSLTAEKAAEGAFCGSLVGKTTTDLQNAEATVELTYTAPGAAAVAAIAGSAENCTVAFVETYGGITVTGQNKTVGLFVGDARNAKVNDVVFSGAKNSQDGKLFTNYFGAEENVTWQTMLVRDNSREPEQPHIQEKRQKVADYMNECTTIRWKVRHDMVKSSTSCTCSSCHGSFSAEYTYIGAPYNHKASSLYRMKYAIDEEGYLKEFVEYAGAGDGFDMYIGSDCSTSTCMALQTVSPTVCYTQTQDQVPAFGKGTYTVGPYVLDPSLNLNNAHKTKDHCDYNGEEVMFESYAQMRMGDAVVQWYDGAGHSRLAVADAVVVRDENGKINGNYSYVTMTEMGHSNTDDVNMTYTAWCREWDYSFSNLLGKYYIPTTIEEFITGEFPEIDCKLVGGVEDSRFGLTTGTIQSNYSIDSVTMVITDESGKEVYNHRIFTTSSKMTLDGTNHSRNRAPCKEYNLSSFATPLQQQVAFERGETYHATIYANLMTGDEIPVHQVTFTNG